MASQKRQLASHAHKPLFAELKPPPGRTTFTKLLQAIQKHDTSSIAKSFIKWTKELAQPNAADRRREVERLPATTVSEILRSLDPSETPDHDLANGLRITNGQVQWSDAGKMVDKFGVRRQHRQVLAGVQLLFDIRSEAGHALTPRDFEILIRCAGLAQDFQAAKNFWAAMAAQGIQDSRTQKTWTEFMKARYVTEPEYYQHDRARVMFLARDLVSNRSPVPMATIKKLDNVRFSVNALQRNSWNRRLDEEEEDIRRLLRRRNDFRAFKGHWIRSQYYGLELDEELICTSMIAFARSSSLRAINSLILDNIYGIQVELGSDPATTTVSGGYSMPADSPVKPTARLLDAIVDAFGSMAHLPLGLKLVNYISQRYSIPIPRETWSNLLNWAYTGASKPFSTTRAIHGNYASTTMTSSEVLGVWNVMTSPTYDIIPSFDDYTIYVKALVEKRAYGTAVTAIREHMMPLYQDAAQEYENALADEILQTDAAGSQRPEATRRRASAELHKDHMHHNIASVLLKLFKSASKSKSSRDGPVMQVLIPKLVAEFSHFLPSRIRYRTGQGVAVIERPDAMNRIESWTPTFRHTSAQKKAGIYARDVEGSSDPEFKYPTVPSMRVLELRPQMKQRLTYLGTPPKDATWRGWWDRLEEDMML